MRKNILFGLLLILVLAIVMPLGSAAAQGGDTAPQTITVTGFGTAYAAPDIAVISAGVEAIDKDVTVAVTQADATNTAVMDALKAQGVAEEDIRTENFYIYRESFYGPEGPTGEGQFHVTNTLSVNVNDTSLVSDVLSAMITAGATNVNGVNFSVADTAGLESEARRLAIDDARATAEELAQLMGVSVGDVVAITEYSQPSQPFYNYGMGGGGGGGGAPVPPIQGGSLAVTINVEVKFALVR